MSHFTPPGKWATSSSSSSPHKHRSYRKPKVALIGSGGLLGDATLTAFLLPEFADSFSYPIRVLTRDVAQQVPDRTTFIRVDWDSDDIHEQLIHCLHGVGVIVNLLGYNRDAWDAVTSVVCTVKPQLYIPPEFSVDWTQWDRADIPPRSVVYDKMMQTSLAQACGIHTVQIFCGIIMENMIAGPHTGFDFSVGKPRILEVDFFGGKYPISFTSAWDVGRSIAAIAMLSVSGSNVPFTKCYISGDTSSWIEVASTIDAKIAWNNLADLEMQSLNHKCPIETFLRVAAARGELYYPKVPSLESVTVNQNDLVNEVITMPSVKLIQVIKYFDQHEKKKVYNILPGYLARRQLHLRKRSKWWSTHLLRAQ
ncbi:hypothetical protein TWF694_004681 [Orbilia ellipsospora]|uniref:NmrA-like domain-containing protein n=1 Tax=Orbilia ellipsospora TaxID=2528407 RepID=A0AAV9WWT7_9PEZI